MKRRARAHGRTPVRAYENPRTDADALLEASILPLGVAVLARVFGVPWGWSFGMAGIVAVGSAIDAGRAVAERTRR